MIKAGSKIGVFSPSSYVERSDIEASQAHMEASGYEVFIHPQSFAQHHQSAGTTAEKLEALHSLYSDPSIDAIWAAGGGNRALDMLDGLDIDLIKANPKPLIGYSDVTCLLNALYVRTGQIGFHAPVFKELHKTALPPIDAMPLDKATFMQGGDTQGVIVGGCLSLFHLLVGTESCPPLQGTILMLEDTGDQVSRFDRMFLDMKHKGVFEQISAVILGEFHDLQDGARPFGYSLDEIVREAVGSNDVAIIMNAPFGHGANNRPFPIGGRGIIDKNSARLNFEF